MRNVLERDGAPYWEVCYPPVSFIVGSTEDRALSPVVAE